MCSDVPAHASTYLLNTTIRGEFNQSLSLIVSDTGDIAALQTYRICTDSASCAARALTAGVDIEQPPGTTYLSLPEAVQRGLVTQKMVDDAVRRVLTHKFSLRLFDNPYVNTSLVDEVIVYLLSFSFFLPLMHSRKGKVPDHGRQ